MGVEDEDEDDDDDDGRMHIIVTPGLRDAFFCPVALRLTEAICWVIYLIIYLFVHPFYHSAAEFCNPIGQKVCNTPCSNAPITSAVHLLKSDKTSPIMVRMMGLF